MEALNINKTEIIVDKNIRLKVVEPEDAEPIFNTINNEREYLKEWLPFVEETHDIAYRTSRCRPRCGVFLLTCGN